MSLGNEATRGQIVQLLDAHRALKQAFRNYQRALLRKDFASARQIFERYERALGEHIRLEEDTLMPVYEKLEPVPGGAPELFLSEHRKIECYVDEFKQVLAELESLAQAGRSSEVEDRLIDLFERHAFYRLLLEHHDERERKLFYPRLDAETPKELREQLIDETARHLESVITALGLEARELPRDNLEKVSHSLKPTDILKHEHRIIEKALRALEGMIEAVKAGQELSADDLEGFVSFMRTFADQCHHGKEEGHLFPSLQAHGIPLEGGPIGVMLSEHESGRALMRQLQDVVDLIRQGSDYKDRFLQTAASMIELYQQHIMKEDNILFQMADQVLEAEEAGEIVKRFDEVERQLGIGTHEEMERKVEELVSRWSAGQKPEAGGGAKLTSGS